MKIKRDDLKKIIKILKNFPYNPAETNAGFLFFPIEPRDIESESFSLSVKTNVGAASCCVSGLIISYKDEKENYVNLSYSNIEYSPKLDIVDYLSFQTQKLKKSDLELISDLDCYLIKKEYIMGVFKI